MTIDFERWNINPDQNGVGGVSFADALAQNGLRWQLSQFAPTEVDYYTGTNIPTAFLTEYFNNKGLSCKVSITNLRGTSIGKPFWLFDFTLIPSHVSDATFKINGSGVIEKSIIILSPRSVTTERYPLNTYITHNIK